MFLRVVAFLIQFGTISIREILIMSSSIIKNPHKKPVNKKGIIITVVASLFVVVSGVGAWYMWFRDSGDSASETSQSAPEIVDEVAVDWEIANTETDFDKGEASLTERLNSSTTDARRAEVYLQLFGLSINNGQYDKAHEYASKAEEIEPTRQTAYAIGAALDAAGQRDAAIQQYQVAIERTEKEIESNGDEQGGLRRYISDMNYYINGGHL